MSSGRSKGSNTEKPRVTEEQIRKVIKMYREILEKIGRE
jgi:hypothetical protein